MAGTVALFLVQQIDMDLTMPGFAAQVVVTHHAVEIEGLCSPGVALYRDHLGHLTQFLCHTVGHVGGDR